MSLRHVTFTTLTTIALLSLTGCLNVDAKVSAPAPSPGPAEGTRYTPYGAALSSVLDQQATVENELAKRDWEELRDEIGDWQGDARKLMSQANSSHDPDRLRSLSRRLLREIDRMKRAAARQDADTVQAALDAAGPILDQMAEEFPTTEPVPE